MDLAAFLGTVVAIATIAIGAMYMIVRLLGRQIDQVGADLSQISANFNSRIDDTHRRIDDLDNMLTSRLTRLETQNDAIIGAIGDLGQRVARLESH